MMEVPSVIFILMFFPSFVSGLDHLVLISSVFSKRSVGSGILKKSLYTSMKKTLLTSLN
jgi:hypothetical protein